MMKLLLLIATMIALFGVVVAEAISTRNNHLQQNHRMLKKDKDQINWEQFAAEIQDKVDEEEEKEGEVDWNAFAADLVSIALAAQPTVSPTTTRPASEPSASPAETPTPAPSQEATLTPTKQPSDDHTPAPTLGLLKDPTIKPTEQPSISQTTTDSPTAKPTEFSFVFSFGSSAVTIVTLPSFRLDFVATINMNRKLRQDKVMTGDTERAIIEMISNEILSYLQGNLSRVLVSVDLNVEDKRESHFPEIPQMVMFSYDLSGFVTFAGGEDELPSLPTSHELLTKVVGHLETESFKEVMKSFDNSGLLSIDDVAVSTPNASGTASQIQEADSNGVITDNSNEGGNGAIATPVVIAFVTVFALTIAVIAFITVQKYRQYQQNENDGSFERVKTTTYQNMKERFNSLTPLGRNRRYDHFESPAGSVFGDIEDNDTEYPITANVDIEQLPSPTRETQLSNLSYLSNEARKAIGDDSDTTSDRGLQNRTLDLLYSDSDSYFGSSVGTSIVSAGVRPRMLSNDFVYSDTDSSFHSHNNPHSANVHSIAKINQLVLDNETVPNDGNSEITVTESAAEEVAANDIKDEHPNASEFSITDNLFARLTELENKIIYTESQFSLEDGTTTKERLGDYKNAYREAEDSSAVHKRNFSDGIFTEETLGMIQRDRLRGSPPPSEGELDGAAIDCSKSASLLGNVPDDSDADDDDELLFQGSISTIESEVDSHQ